MDFESKILSDFAGHKGQKRKEGLIGGNNPQCL
jgi:hypothetical protein